MGQVSSVELIKRLIVVPIEPVVNICIAVVSTNCVVLRPSTNSFQLQPPSSWSTASLSPGLTTATAYYHRYAARQPALAECSSAHHLQTVLDDLQSTE